MRILQGIQAIAISSQGIAIVPVDRGGNAMGNAISWLDVRAAEEVELLRRRYGVPELYQLTGKSISPLYTLPKIMWLQKNRPEVYHSCWKLMMPMDFIQYKLCGGVHYGPLDGGGNDAV